MKRIIYAVLALVFFTAPLAYTAQQESNSKPVTRAAFDLGSGSFKLVVADVHGDDVKVKFAKSISVGLGMDLAESKDQTLSKRVQDVALKTMQQLKKDADRYNATEHSGIATEVFRKAKNGMPLLTALSDKTDVKLQIVSQAKEGLIGFNSAAALSREIDKNHVISWDSGGASFQIGAKDKEDFQVYQGPLGDAVVLKILSEEVRKTPYNQTAPVNPITADETASLIKAIQAKIDQPKWLKQKLADSRNKVVGIGEEGSIFGVVATYLKTDHFTIDQVREVMEKMVGKTDQDFVAELNTKRPGSALTRVALLYAVMEKFGIHEVFYKKTEGSTIGLLIDQDFWGQVVPKAVNG
jgi:exopolyphosphatase/pppGpp-phosphohydrolase